MSLLLNLQQRHVFRAVAWYAGVAWLAIEVSNTVFPQFGLPDWSVRAVIVVAMLGLPIVVALAWWLDLSRLGLRREQALPEGLASAQVTPGQAAPAAFRAPSLWIALVIGVGLALSAQQAWRHLVSQASGTRAGLAVLPFANLSADPANAYLADGLHEEILATLARAGGLRVISRTSVEQYRDPHRNLREIADALEVSLILEGSVLREGNSIRLSVQLIDAATDRPIWSETYDRPADGALQLQRTVALRVVTELGARLSPGERLLVDSSLPRLPKAYDRYLHAMALYAQRGESIELERLLGETLELEPDFALALALRSKVRTFLFAYGPPGTDAAQLAEGARSDFQRALDLQPELPAALVARALHELWVVPEPRGNLEAALADLQRALEISPNDAEAHDVAAVTLRRLGRFDEALAYFEQVSLLRPGPEARMAIVQTLLNTGRFEALENELRSIAVRYPSEKWPALLQEFVEFLRSGDTDGWHDLHERIAPGLIDLYRSYLTWRLLICTGDYAGLAELYSGRDPLTLPGASPDLDLGIVHVLLGDSDRARPLLLAAASAGRKPADLRQAVNASMVRAAGAMALALLGENTDAVREADAAVELLPESRDAVNGPQVAMARAWVLIATGERAEEGYAELQRLLGAWELWPRWVAARPEWRLLAGDSRVQIIFEAAYAAP